ncbi:MAG: nucleotide pyrophosphohydrolase [Actinomycetales bacterium]
MSDLTELRDGMRRFTEERDWGRFHDPKSLALALTGEVGEVAELLQWLPAEQARDQLLAEPLATRVAEELSDVLLYLVRLADVLSVDLASAASQKLREAEVRFSAEEHFGRAPQKP